MKAAIVRAFGSAPVYGDFEDAAAGAGQVSIEVRASALSPLVRSQAAGGHYSSVAVFPFVPGVDGVGRLPDGRRVYFAFPKKPFGAMASTVAIDEALVTPIPDDVDDVIAAAIANPGMSSWAALSARARLVPGESVLVNGATGAAGALAVRIAKHLGAARVIATGRNQAVLESLLGVGADEVIVLDKPADELRRAFRETIRSTNVSVVLDYLWGPSAEAIIGAVAGDGSGKAEPRIRFVQIGSSSGGTITMPGGVLRSSGLELLGSGLGSLSHAELVRLIGELLRAVRPANLELPTVAVPLERVESAWNEDTGKSRLVFTI